MRHFHRSVTHVVALLIVAVPQAQSLRIGTPESVGMSSERLARIRPAMQVMVDDGHIPAVETLVYRRGVVVHHERIGVEADAMFRIASMTKVVTTVAVMMLMEQGKLLLSDPLSRFIPAFKDTRVLAAAGSSTSGDEAGTVPARRQMTIEDLLTHRSGIVYGFIDRSPVGEMYRKNGVCDAFCGPGVTLEANVDLIARQPLKFQPGSAYEYSLSIDVLGRVVEVASGLSLDEFFQRRIFEPLGMRDTHFSIPAAKASRLVPLFAIEKKVLTRATDQGRFTGQTYYAGGAGLVSTAGDYLRFAQMLLNGGELDGARLLSRPTVDLMTTSHTQDLGPGTVSPGYGFGYGGAVRESLGRSHRPGSEGAYHWSGIFGTYFWIDRAEQLIAIQMHQLLPRSNRSADVFHVLTYGAILN